MKKRNANTNKPKKTFLSQSKINLFNFIVATLAMVISLLAYCNDSRQTEIQKRQLEAQKNENQPNFQVNYRHIDVNNDNVPDTEIFELTNDGREVRSIYNIRYIMFVKISVRRFYNYGVNNSGLTLKEDQVIYIPVKGYYNSPMETNSVKGDLITDSITNNLLTRGELFKDIRSHNSDSIVYYTDFLKYVLIEFDDIYNEHKELCIKEKTNNIELFDIIQKIDLYFPNVWFDINDLTFENIQKYIEFDFNNMQKQKRDIVSEDPLVIVDHPNIV